MSGSAGVPEVIQGKGGELRERGIHGAGGESWAVRANHGQWGQIAQKRHFTMFCYYNFLLTLGQSKREKFGTLLPLWAKGDRGSHLLWPRCPAPFQGLIYRF